MSTLTQQPVKTTYSFETEKKKVSAFRRFINWCDGQEQYRFGWLAAILASHGCLLTPITMFAIVLSNNSMIFWALALGSMGMALVTNLAATPTRVVIPTFFLSIIIDVTIIVSCLLIGFSFSGAGV